MGSRENIQGGELSSPLLDVAGSRNSGGDCGSGGSQHSGSEHSSATTMVVLSTLVAVSGSYVFGSAVSLSFYQPIPTLRLSMLALDMHALS